MTVPPPEGAVAEAFASYAGDVRATLLAVRGLILETAAATDGVGPLTETLKWGEPAYLTEKTKAGSTIRLGPLKGSAGRCAMFVNCNTTLADGFRAHFSDDLEIDGDRAVVLAAGAPVPEGPLRACIAMALTYHRRKRSGGN